jgi:hypothetical protein
MAMAVWGADDVMLRGGAGARVSAGWRSSTGGQWWRLVKDSEGEGFSREGLPRAPSLPRFQTENNKGSISGEILCWALIRYAGESLWSICIGRKRKGIEFARAMVCMAEFKIQI